MEIVDRTVIDKLKPSQEFYKWFIRKFNGRAQISEFLDALEKENKRWYRDVVTKLICIEMKQKNA